MIEVNDTANNVILKYEIYTELSKHSDANGNVRSFTNVDTQDISIGALSPFRHICNAVGEVTFNIDEDKFSRTVKNFLTAGRRENYTPQVEVYIACECVKPDMTQRSRLYLTSYFDNDFNKGEDSRNINDIVDTLLYSTRALTTLVGEHFPDFSYINTRDFTESAVDLYIDSNDGEDEVVCVIGTEDDMAYRVCCVPLEEAVEECRVPDYIFTALDKQNRGRRWTLQEDNESDISRLYTRYNNKFVDKTGMNRE